MFGLEDLRRLTIQIQGKWVHFRLQYSPPSSHLFQSLPGARFEIW